MDKIQETYREWWSVKRTAAILKINEQTVRNHLTDEDKDRSVYKTMHEGDLILLYPNPENFEININGTLYNNFNALITLFDYKPKRIYVWRLEQALSKKWLPIKANSVKRDNRDRLVSIEFGGAVWYSFTPFTNKQPKIEDLAKSIDIENDSPTTNMKNYITYWNEKTGGRFLYNKTISNTIDKLFWQQFSEEESAILHNEIESLIPPPKLYRKLLNNDFGGLIITNRCYSILKNVKSFDIKSAYGGNFINERFPIKPFKKTMKPIDILIKEDKPFCCHVLTKDPLPYLKQNAGNSYWLTDVMIKEFIKLNAFVPALVIEVYESEYGKLNPIFTNKIKDLYLKKEELKSTNIAASNLNKFMIQNIYGKSIQNIFRGLEPSEKRDFSIIRERYRNRYLLPQWGVWSHDYTFALLLSLCRQLKEDGIEVIATDTDCIRFIDKEDRGETIIKDYNKRITETSMGSLELEGIRELYCGRKSKTYCYIQNDKLTLKMAGIDTIELEEWQSQFSNEEILNRFACSDELKIGGQSEYSKLKI